MTINTQEALRILEAADEICFLDMEATGLNADYCSSLVFSIKPYRKPVQSFVVEKPGFDKKLVRQVRDCLESFTLWVSYHGKGYDIPFLRTRLLKWNQRPLEDRHHIDLYFALKGKLLTARKSQGHLLALLKTKSQKMSVSPNTWSEVQVNPEKCLDELRRRCESDVIGLEALYNRTKNLIKDIKK